MFKKHRVCADHMLLSISALDKCNTKLASKHLALALASADVRATLREISSMNEIAFKKTRGKKRTTASSAKRKLRSRLARELSGMDEFEGDDGIENELEESMPEDDMEFEDDFTDLEESMPEDDEDMDMEEGEMDEEMEDDDDEEMDMEESRLIAKARVKKARANLRKLR